MPVDALGYLLEALGDAGTFKRDAMGNLIPLDWLDIDAFARRTGDITEAWECKALLKMSAAFVRGLNEGESVFSVAPIDRSRE